MPPRVLLVSLSCTWKKLTEQLK